MSTDPQDHQGWQRPDDAGVRPASASLVDPEDDLAATFGGDLETTAIPRYGTSAAPNGAPAGGVQSPYSLLNDPEPLPYVQPSPPQAYGSYAAEPVQVGVDDSVEERVRAAGRRGTTDLGLLLLRVGFGLLLIAHGLQKTFGWWGGSGLGGFRDSLAETGFRYADILTYLGVVTEIGAGVLLVLGLLTPLAAAAALAYLLNGLLAGIAAAGGGLPFFLPDGLEFQLTLFVIAAVIVLAGPGRYGLDAGRGWARRPFVGSFIALVLGVGLGIAVWVLLNGTNPLA
ncbi:DoxX family membrane protein [uncultured Mycolicibacterium sp.]|uniref:DoxX family membrane protein n=1 Tax=uncultured Mycolicibacterium sp. TaxID=2320817 RepID=UPI002634424E|nr:DoxX family membrane protein [uncultured Mycolicibacterium sp.]